MIPALLDHLWQSTLFGVAIWLVALGFRSNGAALRHWLWLLASIKFLVPFAALYLAGSLIHLPILVGGRPVLLNDAIAAAAPVVLPSGSLEPLNRASNGPAIALIFIWVAGALFIAVRWLLAWRSAHFLVRAARPAPGALLDAHLTDAQVEPAVAGSFHPVVLLPVALLGRLAPTQLNAVLAHEHEHIRRHDNPKAGIHRLVETLFWFHPLVWWIGRRLVEERELACDEAVLENGHDEADYAAGIIAVCQQCQDWQRVPSTISAVAGDLTQRIRRILGGARPRGPGVVKLSALLLGTLAAAGIPLLSGAADGSMRRQQSFETNLRLLAAADIRIAPAANTVGTLSLQATEREVLIRSSTLRDLVALAYGVEAWQVGGAEPWMKDRRYDVRLWAHGRVGEPGQLDPGALRGAVAKLLGARFDVEIHVDQRCQAPCGRNALKTATPAS